MARIKRGNDESIRRGTCRCRRILNLLEDPWPSRKRHNCCGRCAFPIARERMLKGGMLSLVQTPGGMPMSVLSAYNSRVLPWDIVALIGNDSRSTLLLKTVTVVSMS